MNFKQIPGVDRRDNIKISPMNLAAAALVPVFFCAASASAQNTTLTKNFYPATNISTVAGAQSDEGAEPASATAKSDSPCPTAPAVSLTAENECLRAKLAAIDAEQAKKAAEPQKFNFHQQYTFVGMGYPSFSAKYTNPAYSWSGTKSSLPTNGQARETMSVDLYYGYRLGWDSELHIDGLVWQGFGLNNTYGISSYPNGEAFKVGTKWPHFTLAKFFVRKTFNLDGKRELSVDDDQMTLATKQDTNRIVVTLGKISTKDIFDNNAYANDPREQFMNWALMGNTAWDYPADSLGFTTGIAAEWYTKKWTVRYGWMQVPRLRNGYTAESQFLMIPSDDGAGSGRFFHDWGTVVELEHRHSIATHPGAVRFLVYDNHVDLGSYKEAVALANNAAYISNWCINNGINPTDTDLCNGAAYLASANNQTGGIDDTHKLRNTWGVGLNMDQEITKNVGVFSRVGWNVGQNESWMYNDSNWVATAGVSIKGEKWKHPDDTIGAGFIASGISQALQDYLAAGGIGILTGDGALNYAPEKNIELYYSHKLNKYFNVTGDYQFVDDPAYNHDRGPIPGIFAVRLHFEH